MIFRCVPDPETKPRTLQEFNFTISYASKICHIKRWGNRNPSVTGGYSLWTKVRRKGKGSPWPGGSVPPWRDWNHEALVSSGTGRGPRPPASFGGSSVRSPGLWASRPMLPARTARTPSHNTACTPPLFTEGLPPIASFSFSTRK